MNHYDMMNYLCVEEAFRVWSTHTESHDDMILII